MRERYERFVRYVIEEMAVGDRPLEESLKAAGIRMHWHSKYGPLSERSVLKKAKILLARPDISEAIGDFFEVAADFSPVDAAKKMVDWIEGKVEHEQTTVTKDGAVVTVTTKLPPSEGMLKQYFSMRMPRPAKKVEIDQRSVVARVMIGEEPPKLRARIIDAKVKELPSGD